MAVDSEIISVNRKINILICLALQNSKLSKVECTKVSEKNKKIKFSCVLPGINILMFYFLKFNSYVKSKASVHIAKLFVFVLLLRLKSFQSAFQTPHHAEY